MNKVYTKEELAKIKEEINAMRRVDKRVDNVRKFERDTNRLVRKF